MAEVFLNMLCLCSEYAAGQYFRFSEVVSSFQSLLLPSWDWGNLNSSVSLALHLRSTATKNKVPRRPVLLSCRCALGHAHPT